MPDLNEILVVGAVFYQYNEQGLPEVLALRRKDDVLGDGTRYWELPGGKVQAGEPMRTALKREIKEELGIDVGVGELFGEVIGPTKNIVHRIVFFECSAVATEPGEMVNVVHDQAQWWPVSEHLDYKEFLPLDIAFLQQVLPSVLREKEEREHGTR